MADQKIREILRKARCGRARGTRSSRRRWFGFCWRSRRACSSLLFIPSCSAVVSLPKSDADLSRLLDVANMRFQERCRSQAYSHGP